MTDSDATYAIAFPMGPDYIKVLRHFVGLLPSTDKMRLDSWAVPDERT